MWLRSGLEKLQQEKFSRLLRVHGKINSSLETPIPAISCTQPHARDTAGPPAQIPPQSLRRFAPGTSAAGGAVRKATSHSAAPRHTASLGCGSTLTCARGIANRFWTATLKSTARLQKTVRSQKNRDVSISLPKHGAPSIWVVLSSGRGASGNLSSCECCCRALKIV